MGGCRVSAVVALWHFVLFFTLIWGADSQSQTAPQVEQAAVLLDSFIPASMQVIAHLTDLMKYELRPSFGSGTPTTTTLRPTPPHKPALFAPQAPPGPTAYFARSDSFQEYVKKLREYHNLNRFDGYKYPAQSGYKTSKDTKLPSDIPEDLELFGIEISDILKQVNKLDDYDFEDEDDRLLRFSDNYDDADLRTYVTGQKKVPPTKAYVTLLGLYDMLNKESKKLELNKYGGYSSAVLQVLEESSSGTAADQLKTVLSKVVEKQETNDQSIIKKVKALLLDLEKSDSYLNDALRYIPPLQFAV